jgi:hypothetical protein
MRSRLPIAAAALIAIASCSDSPSCSSTEPCPEGADVAITSERLEPDGSVNPATGLRVVDQPRVSYTLVNRGSAASDTVIATIYYGGRAYPPDTVIGLAPRQEIRRMATLDAPHFVAYSATAGDRRVAIVQIVTTDSTDNTANNSDSTDTFHIRAPMLEITMEPPRELVLRVNQPALFTVTIKNHSQYSAARSIKLQHCLVDFDIGCWYNWTTFGNVPLADIAPGESRTLTYMTAVTPTAMEERLYSYSLGACVAAQQDTAVYRDSNQPWVCASPGRVTVYPDYESCSPPRLSAQPVTLTAPNCGTYPMHRNDTPTSRNWMKYFVFSIDALAGQTYQINGLGNVGGVQVVNTLGWTVNGLGGERYTFAQTGRHYVINYAPSGTRTVSAVLIP